MTNKNVVFGILSLGLLIAITAAVMNIDSSDNNKVTKPETATTTNQLEAVVVNQTEEGEASSSVEAVAVATTSIEAEVVAPVVSTKPVVTPKPAEPTPTPTPAPVLPSGITMAEVRIHSDASSCWSAINGSVYDLTTYIPKHPGGKGEILAICGEDGSSAFGGQHGGDSKPERILATYKIDELSN